MNRKLSEYLPVEDDGSKHPADEGARELEAESLPGGHGQPGVAHAVRGPVGAVNMQRREANVPNTAQQSVGRENRNYV